MKIKWGNKYRKNEEIKRDFTVNIGNIGGDGNFPCPKCGAIISPDDETEETYQILQTKVKNDELAELIIQCNKCQSKITLIGFISLS